MMKFLLLGSLFLVCMSNVLSQNEVDNNDTPERKIVVPFALWIGSDINTIHKTRVYASPNTTFYEIMQIAAQEDPRFNFTTVEYPNLGHFVTGISGIELDPFKNMYWMLYNRTDSFNPFKPPTTAQLSPLGVDSLTVQRGQHYLFWYQHFIA